MSRIQDAQPTLAVLSMVPGAGLPAPDAIRAACEDISGVNALRIDADRGRIHVLYDGSSSAIEQVASVLRDLGFGHAENGPSLECLPHTTEKHP